MLRAPLYQLNEGITGGSHGSMRISDWYKVYIDLDQIIRPTAND
ncbi:hypothetical protein ALT721_1350010 [Alteromonas alvinellae]